MSITERKERQRAERYELLLTTARELAEAEGWDAVTTRRLAGLINYSQPVIYSHFKGKTDIMAAVAIRGFEELATRLRMETANINGAPAVLRNTCAAYLDFARSRPVIYEAMFVLPTDLRFADAETRPELRAAFEALATAVTPFCVEVEAATETLWAALHGLTELERSGRIRSSARGERIEIVVRSLIGSQNSPPDRSS
ncbi:TetR/AcrR family transcriptional regulator [Dyella sp.]|uniref:TetR/AcrR family transcriptional regulator n=1 Tax=Dyella sp. TaxID=1869338 RepID=UPI00284EB3DE|nr:TetR/AcrR family transcriptional regulator [Dyella sp.]MDR3446676.1 TetR/AcrR family transcriptional regulator [Dyella sp.]